MDQQVADNEQPVQESEARLVLDLPDDEKFDRARRILAGEISPAEAVAEMNTKLGLT